LVLETFCLSAEDTIFPEINDSCCQNSCESLYVSISFSEPNIILIHVIREDM
jgi:hypothetical protein